MCVCVCVCMRVCVCVCVCVCVPASIENWPRFDPTLARCGSIQYWTHIGSEHWFNEVMAVGPTLAFQYWPRVVNKHRPDAFPWMDRHWPDIIYTLAQHWV